MENKKNGERALIMLVIIIMLGSGTSHKVFGSQESEKVSRQNENVDTFKYERDLADKLDMYSDATSLPEDQSQQNNVADSTLFASLLRAQNIFAPSAIAQALYGASVGDTAKGTSGSKDAGGQSLQEKATDPTSVLTQLQIQNIFTPSTHDASGYSNTMIIQPVIPLPTGWDFFQTQIIRPTLPLNALIADPDGPIEETSGLGDLVVFDLFLPKRESWGTWGVGPVAIFPTASDDRLGAGKWQLGPAAVVLYSGIKNWQLGGLVQNPISFAGDSDRDAVSTFLFQPIATRHFDKGWYAGWGELPFSYEWLNGQYNVPLNVRVGRVTKMNKAPVNVFLEPFFTPSGLQKEGQSEWGFKFNVTFLFP
jgi:hypothetical protein